MPKRRYHRYTRAVKRRARRYYGKARRRLGSAKIPLEVAITGISIPFTPATSSSQSPIDLAKSGNWKQLLTDVRHGFIGMGENGQIDIMATLNPFNMEAARYTKMLAVAALISRVRKRFVHIPMKKVPFVGRYIS